MLLEDKIETYMQELKKLETSRIRNLPSTQEKIKELKQELCWMRQFLGVKEVIHEWSCDVLYKDKEKNSKYYFNKILSVFEDFKDE